jgi:iron complex transport system substrate-binding protein
MFKIFYYGRTTIKVVFFLFIFFNLTISSFSYPIKIKDDIGEVLTIKKEPKRIVSLAPNITDTLLSLSLLKKIVGATSFCKLPKKAKVTRIGGFSNPNLEKIIALKPDIIIATYGNPLSLIKKLKKLKIPIFVINPHDLKEIYESIIKIGILTNREKRAKSLVSKAKKEVRFIKKKLKDVKKKKVFLIIWDNPLITVGKKSFLNELINLAGGINIAGDVKIEYPVFSFEKVLYKNPDVIILAGMNKKYGLALLKKIKKDKRWRKITAVKKGKVYLINPPDIILQSSLKIIKGLKQLAKKIHPEVFK